VEPFIKSGLNRFPLNTKYGGKALPMALAHPITVVVVDLGEVIASRCYDIWWSVIWLDPCLVEVKYEMRLF
jgi:hypothetical protein